MVFNKCIPTQEADSPKEQICSASSFFAALLGPFSLSPVERVCQIKKETNFHDPFLITSHASLVRRGLLIVSAGRSESL